MSWAYWKPLPSVAWRVAWITVLLCMVALIEYAAALVYNLP